MRKKVRTFCIRWAKGHPCYKGQRFTTRFAISSLTNAKWVGPSKDSPAVCPIGLRIFPRDLGYVRAFFETLGDNPRLLLGRPPAPPCDQFDSAITPVFLPGIKHGICHRLSSHPNALPKRPIRTTRLSTRRQ